MNKKFWITALAFGLPWSLIMIVFNGIINWEIEARMLIIYLIAGIFGGIIFSLLMQIVGRRLMKKIKITLPENENLFKETAANHLIKKEGVGGKLALTESQLIFQSHNFNIQNHQQVFNLIDIISMTTAKSMFILENRLNIKLINQENHIFIVDEPNQWIKAVEEQKSKLILN